MQFNKQIMISLLLIICGCTQKSTDEEKIVLFNVKTGNTERNESIVSLPLDDITSMCGSELSLFEITDNGKTPVEFQIFSHDRRFISWKLSGITPAGKERKYELSKIKSSPAKPNVNIKRVETGYEFEVNGKPVICYNSEMVYPPEGVDESYKRSGFIHPLYAPDKTVLTKIQPEDHYHHYGIWNPWTKTKFRDEEVDFWNLKKLQGTVRHAGIISLEEGNIFGSLGFLLEHISWPGSSREVKAITEYQEIKVYNRNDGIFMIDITSLLCPVESITLEEYRYGGFGYRATEYWTKENTEIFTSEGKVRDEADGERAKWCVINGETQNGHAGILFMGHPSNYNHPEPLRVWPSNSNNDRGDIFVNFSPTRNTDWILETGKTYLLRYRLMVSNGKFSAPQAENLWSDYSNPVTITRE